MPVDPRIEQVLRLLIELIEERIERDPGGHLLQGRGGELTLEFDLPLADPGDLDEPAEAALRTIDDAVRELLERRSSFRAGRVFCLRCRVAECEHARPSSCRQVFAGYSPSGVPLFRDLGELLLALGDDRVGELFDERGQLVTRVMTGEDLTRELLPAFRSPAPPSRILGQVIAGWYRVPGPGGRRESMALSLQLLAGQPRRGRRRFGVNLVGEAPGGTAINHLHERLGGLPWSRPLGWAQSIAAGMKQPSSGRVEGLLAGLARRLERSVRSRSRRTAHAESRHSEGARPTRMALADLRRAGEGAILFDRRKRTMIVLGDRGRCHVFSPAGRLVTSVRYPTPTIERRRQSGLWREATAEQRQALQAGTSPEDTEKK